MRLQRGARSAARRSQRKPIVKPDLHQDHKDVANFYDNVYYRHAGEESTPVESWHLRSLVRRLQLRPGQRILDVACGTGEWLCVAHRHGLDVAGVDISRKAIDVCRQRLPNGDFKAAPAERLDFPDQAFDCVTCLGSLEHFLDQQGALREMARVLRPRGKIVLLVPNAGFLPYRLGLYRGTHQQAVRETIRSLEEWHSMFRDSGLDVLQRWRDLHIVNSRWIVRRPWSMVIPRFVQAALLPLWPLAWQYQVYHLCARVTPAQASCNDPTAPGISHS